MSTVLSLLVASLLVSRVNGQSGRTGIVIDDMETMSVVLSPLTLS